MEFNVLPKSKFVNASPRATHKSNQENHQNQTINVILPQSNTADEASVSISTRDVKLDNIAPEEIVTKASIATPEEIVTKNKEDSISTISFLKLILQSYMNNPIKYNGYVICTVPLLEQLIEIITGCDDCSIEIPDLELGCCGSIQNKILPITKIWVRNGDSSEIFKYRYSNLLHIFEEYRISLKFIYSEN